MSVHPRLIVSSLFVLFFLSPVLAQDNRAPGESPREPIAPAPLVTASATSKRVRFVAPGTVLQLRLEVYNETGQKVFDTEQRGGNVLDWHLQDGAGQRQLPGSYACVLTIKSLSGRLSQRVGLVTVDDEQAEVASVGSAKLSPSQQESIGPVDGEGAFTVRQPSEEEAVTAVVHDGNDGQVARTRGALSFRLGDFFSGTDEEQMRLTPEGNLGIGTSEPKAKLDVAGTIRAERVLITKPRQSGSDNSKQAGETAQTTDDAQPLASGIGTQDKIAKWTDNAGTLGDSNIFESATARIGIGTTSPGAKLHVVGVQGSLGASTFQLDASTPFSSFTAAYPAFEVLNTNLTNNNVSLFQFSDVASGASHAGIGAVSTNHTSKFGDLFFFTKGVDGYQSRMGIFSGNVGIGTTAPAAKLQVVGNGLFTGDLTVNGTLSANLPSGSANYIQNTTTQQNANFSIFGNGSIRGTLSTGGVQFTDDFNTSSGLNSRTFTSDVVNGNTFVGLDAGAFGVGGSVVNNAFFGKWAGQNNGTAGFNRGGGFDNAFFGYSSGRYNEFGHDNAFFGFNSGQTNALGNRNAFFGAGAGINNHGDQTAPFSNVFNGSNNAFFGTDAGRTNTTGVSNTIIGDTADVSTNNLTNATAIGANAQVTQSNSLVLGSINNVNGALANTNVGIGTTAPARRLHVNGAGSDGAGQTDLRITGTGQIASGITLESTGTGGRTYSWLSTADNIGGGGSGPGRLAAFDVTAGVYRMVVDGTGNVGIGTFSPGYKLEVNGSVAGNGPYTALSDARFKKNIHSLSGALNTVLRLRGVSFDWRRDEFPAFNFNEGRQIGFIAQEIKGALPEAVTTDNQGYYRMAYAEVTPILVEAIKEQQQTITRLQQENNKLKVSNADTKTRLAVLESSVQRIARCNRQQRRRK